MHQTVVIYVDLAGVSIALAAAGSLVKPACKKQLSENHCPSSIDS